MPEDDDVAVGIDHPDGVGKGLSFRYGCHGHLGDIYDVASESVCGTLERELSTCGRLEEQVSENLSVQGAFGLLAHCIGNHFFGQVENLLDLVLRKVFDGDNVLVK